MFLPALRAAGFVLASAAGCNACQGCFDPALPNVDDEDSPPVDTGLHDTADTGGGDTGPPAKCEVPEVEPNNARSDANELPMETWACGNFSEVNDFEWLTFEPGEAVWIKVVVEAAEIGHKSNVTMLIMDEDVRESASLQGSRSSQDPIVVFPALDTERYYIFLKEMDEGSGDDYDWWLMATETKPPVEWTHWETEPNDTAGQAGTVEPGDVIFGWFDQASDYDWYHIQVPDGKLSWTFDIEAYGSGSPANSRLFLYGPDILDDPDASHIEAAYTGDDSYDLDPRMEISSSEATDWYLLVRERYNFGGAFHWYTLSIDVVEE